MTISYFDKIEKKADDQPGEQTPIYAITFEMYENGISRALSSTTATSSSTAR